MDRTNEQDHQVRFDTNRNGLAYGTSILSVFGGVEFVASKVFDAPVFEAMSDGTWITASACAVGALVSYSRNRQAH